MEIILIVLLTMVNAFLAMSEIALSACRTVRLQVLAESGDKSAKLALTLLERPTQFLSTVQIGITCIAIFNAILGDSFFNKILALFFQKYFYISAATSTWLATGVVVSIITFVTVVFGELVPKRIGQLFPEKIARLIAHPMTIATTIFKPIVRFFEICTGLILKLMGIDEINEHIVTHAEISAQLEQGVTAGVIEKHEHHMVRNVFYLEDNNLVSIMVPREDIHWLNESLTVAQCLESVSQFGSKGAHSCYPVCKGSLDKVVGILRVARLLNHQVQATDLLVTYIEAAVFVPETLTGMELVDRFRAEAADMVLIVDEYGELQGLITPFDVLEAITGELAQSEKEHAWVREQLDGSWLLDGLMPVSELIVFLNPMKLSDYAKGKFNTLGGFIMALSGRLPNVGERLLCGSWLFIIQKIDGRRVDIVQAIPHEKIF
jgi:putative hemolysin